MKKLEQELLSKEQDNSSLQHKLNNAEADLEKAETKLSEAKHASDEGEQNKSANQELLRKVALLEDELDAAEKNLKDCNDKYVVLTDALTRLCRRVFVVDESLISIQLVADYDRSMSRRSISNGKCNELRRSGMSGRTSTMCVPMLLWMF